MVWSSDVANRFAHLQVHRSESRFHACDGASATARAVKPSGGCGLMYDALPAGT